VTKTCLQCGAVLPSSIRACNFCEDSSVSEPAHAGPARAARGALGAHSDRSAESSSLTSDNDSAWRDELAHRLESYRGRKKKTMPSTTQTRLPFETAPSTVIDSPIRSRMVTPNPVPVVVAIPEPPRPLKEEFSFTIAIGRPSRRRDDDTRMIIDVSLPPEKSATTDDTIDHAIPESAAGAHRGLLGTASIDERRLAAVIDTACLMFAYGAFLALFGALGGEFTVSKLSGAVCIATFAIVYLQYFALFTIFGGTTPGMMLRGLQVVSFTGEPPTPRQMLKRSIGYVLSAGTFFLGFLWSMWDEDALTWHDRISQTYLSPVESFANVEARDTAPSH
jgi:uncharacterized RDD family membrane protein YckC